MPYSQWDVDRADTKAQEYEAGGDTGKALEAMKWGNHLRGVLTSAANKSPVDNLVDTAMKARTQTQAPPSYSPTPYQAPTVQTMPYEQAQQQAQARLDPLREQARTSAGTIAQQQQHLLRQQMGAKGQLFGGGIIQGTLDLSKALQRNLTDIDTGYNSQVAQEANTLQEQDYQRRAQIARDAMAAWQAQNSVGLQAAGFNRGSFESDRGYDRGVLESDRGYTRGVLDSDRNYGLNVRNADVQERQVDATITGVDPTTGWLNAVKSGRR